MQFYLPTADELAQWKAAAGAQRKEWDGVKTELVGSTAVFDRLNEAAKTQGKYYVHDA